MKPVLCISHQPSVTLGVAGETFDAIEAPYVFFRAWEEPKWPEPDDYSAVVVLGGEMNVDEHDTYPFLHSVRDVTRDAIVRERPVLGICLGGQMLARALGGDVTRATGPEIGFCPIAPTPVAKDDPVLQPLAELDRVFQWHRDAFTLPDGAELTFTSDDAFNQGFVYGPNAYGVQFHFEVTDEIVDLWCDETPDLEAEWHTSRDELRDQARAFLPAQRRAARTTIERFVELIKDSPAS